MGWQDHFHDSWAPPATVAKLVERGEAYDRTEHGDGWTSFQISDTSDVGSRLDILHARSQRGSDVPRFLVRVLAHLIDLTVVETDSASEAVAAWRAAGAFIREEDVVRKPTKYLVPTATIVESVEIPFDIAVWRAGHPEYDLSLRMKNGYAVVCPLDFYRPRERIVEHYDRQLIFFESVR